MSTKDLYRVSGLFGLLTATGFLFFWFGTLLMVLSRGSVPVESLLSGEALLGRLAVFTQHPWWRVVNVGQCLAVLSGVLFTVSVMLSRRDKLHTLAFLSGLVTLAGFLVMAGTAFAEAVLWQPAAQTAPVLLDTAFGPIYSDRFYLLAVASGEIAFSAGSFLFGFFMLKREGWIGTLLFSVGALLFGMGELAGSYGWGVRTLGVFLYAVGLISVSVNLFRKKGLLITAE